MVHVLVAVVVALAQQAPPRDLKPAPNESAPGAVVAGRVIDADTEAPIAGALVSVVRLRATERTNPVETDEHGAFRVEHLSAGDYRVSVRSPEYKATYLEKTLNYEPGALPVRPSLQLKAREVRDDLVIRLDRALAIEGEVFDELGRPMADVNVTAERVERPGMIGSQQYSDDRGRFRLFNLAPGTYRVCAMPAPSPADYRIGRATSGEPVERPYVKSCSAAVPMKRGSAPPHLVLSVQPVNGFVVSGRIVSESGRRQFSVSLQPLDEFGGQSIPVRVKDGAFIARGVPPGDYVLWATGMPEQMAPGGPPDMERGTAAIRVEGDVPNLEISTRKGATLVGRIVAEAPLPPGTKMYVGRGATYARFAGFGPFSAATPSADLSFELTDVHDAMILDVANLPRGWVVTSVRYRGKEVIDAITRFASTTEPSELAITVSPRSAQLTVRPVDADGRVVEGVRIAMIRITGDRVAVQPRGDGEPRADGGVQMNAARPGEYAVLVVRADAPIARGPEYAEVIRRFGTRVLLESGVRTLEVPVTSLPETR